MDEHIQQTATCSSNCSEEIRLNKKNIIAGVTFLSLLIGVWVSLEVKRYLEK